MLQRPSQHANRSGFHAIRKSWTAKRMVWLAVMAAAGLVLSGLLFYGMSVIRMYSDASRLMNAGQSLANTALGCGSDQSVTDASEEFVTSARALRDELNQPKWTFVRDHTAYGNDIDAARTMLDSVGNLVDGPFSEATNLIGQLNGFSKDNKTIDLSALGTLPSIVRTARADIATETAKLNTVGQPRLSVTSKLLNAGKTGLSSADNLLDEYDELIDLVPQLIGENGTRTYLAVIYNPAELRSAGGMVGNIAAITADHGKVTIGDFSPTTDFKYATEPLDDENVKEAEVFGQWIWKYPQTTTMNPDYQRAAVTLANQWKSQEGNEHKDVAGVIAIDPIFLQSLIGATGSVTLNDGKVLDGTNTGRFFLHDIYSAYPDFAEQNKYTNDASKTIMSHVFSSVNSSTASALLKAVRDSSASSHFKLWMRESNEFAALVQTRVLDANAAGSLPGTSEQPVAGAYFSEMQASKLSWYLHVDITVRKTCGQSFVENTGQGDPDQVGSLMSTRLAGISEESLGDEYTVVLKLKNTLTEEQVEKLPEFVVGTDDTKGAMLLRTTLMAPTGGEITSIAYGNALLQTNGPVEDRQFIVLDPTETGLRPGKTDVIVYTVRVAQGATNPLNVVTTPVIGESGEYTGTGGAVTDECGADVPDAVEDKTQDTTGAQGNNGAEDGNKTGGSDGGSDGANSAGSSGSGSSGGSGSGDKTTGGASEALDSLSKFKNQIQCPVDITKLSL